VLGVPTGEDVAEVTSRDGELDLGLGDVVRELGLDVEVGGEVVDSLSEDTGPVDRVDGAEVEAGVELGVVEELLDDVLWETKE
jgi:hypothetical protein